MNVKLNDLDFKKIEMKTEVVQKTFKKFLSMNNVAIVLVN